MRPIKKLGVTAFTIILSLLAFSFYEPKTIRDRIEINLGRPNTPSETVSQELDPRHPIEDLVTEARSRFAEIKARQSESLDEAVAEYQRRYHRDPPPGFDWWYQIAEANNVTLIDEYDTMMESLEPFWGISAKQVRTMASRANSSQKGFATLSIKNHAVATSKKFRFAKQIVPWVSKRASLLPDMNLTFNQMDEPRVVVPHRNLQEFMKVCPPPNVEEDAGKDQKPLLFVEKSRKSTWNFVTSSCSTDSKSRTSKASSPVRKEYGAMFPKFVKDVANAKDLCSNPEYAHQHGFLVAPPSFIPTTELAPIFSQSKLSSFQDILYPSAAYSLEESESEYLSSQDPDWSRKKDRLYWTGGMTGGYVTSTEWQHMHRHRLVSYLNTPSQPVTLLKALPDGGWKPFRSLMSALSPALHVVMTKVYGCAPSACASMKKSLRIGRPESAHSAYSSRFVFDLDGNAWSGRFHRLLGSKSCVFKQTLFKEALDDWLVPWVHYVPISMSLEEVPEILRWMITSKKGRQVAKEIADEGREWKREVLRDVDLQIAFLRLLFEYARLVDDKRDSSGRCDTPRTKASSGG